MTFCLSKYTCGPDCCNEEMWACDLPKGHTGDHSNTMTWTDAESVPQTGELTDGKNDSDDDV